MTPFQDLLDHSVKQNRFVRIALNRIGHFFPAQERPKAQDEFLLHCVNEGLTLPECASWDVRSCERFCREKKYDRVIRGQFMLFTRFEFCGEQYDLPNR